MPNQVCLCGNAPTGIRGNGDWSRAHGWSLPLHPLQGVAFLFLAMFILLHFGVLVPSLPHYSPWKLVAAVALAVVFIVHIVVLIICMSLDPGDPNVRFSSEGSQGPNVFDRSKRPHVILDQYCCICQVKVGVRSKHCSTCNKCISDFDHHCKWLNNCIGGRNYKLFLVCVTSALIGCFIILVTSLALITAYFCRSSWLNQPISLRIFENSTKMSFFELPTNSSHSSTSHHREGRVFWIFLPVTGTLWLLVVVMTAVLSVMACALLAHLLAFHAYLISQGLSTYEYIVQKRDGSSHSGQSCNTSGHGSSRGTGGQLVKKGLLCPLKKWRRFKMANQILPVTSKEDYKTGDADLSPANAVKNRCSLQGTDEGKSGTEDSRNTSPSSPVRDRQTPEQRAGDIYLGSPLRRARNLLPPISLSNVSEQSQSSPQSHQVSTARNVTCAEETETKKLKTTQSHFEENDCLSEDMSIQCSSHDTSPAANHADPQVPAKNLCSRHLSVSSQSLNSANKEEVTIDFPDQNPPNVEETKIRSELSDSLNNLFILENVITDDEDVNVDDEISVEEPVHDVRIIQNPYCKDIKSEGPLFCPGKGRLESLSRYVGGSLRDLSHHERINEDITIDDICTLNPNYSEKMHAQIGFKRRPSIDVLLIPLGMDSTTKCSYDARDCKRNEGTVLILHSSDSKQKSSWFGPRRTNFLNKTSRQVCPQLIV